MYRHTYRVILKKKGQELYNRVLDFEKDWLRNEVKAGASSFISSSLLLSLNGGSSQSQTTTNERRLLEEKFLRGVREQWQDYQLCMTMLTDVLMYMVGLTTSASYIRADMGTTTGTRLLPGQQETVHLHDFVTAFPGPHLAVAAQCAG